MTIDYTSIHKEDKAIQRHSTGLTSATERRREATLEQARLAVARRLERDQERDEAREEVARIHEHKLTLEADEQKHFAAYQRADYQGDESAAESARAAGELTREQLQRVRVQEDAARANLERVDFDDHAADDGYRAEISALTRLARDGEYEEYSRLIGAITRPVSEPMRQRAEAREETERGERAERRERLLEPYRDAHGVARIPKGGIFDPETATRIA